MTKKILLLSNEKTYTIKKTGDSNKNVVPIMTSNILPSGVVTASSTYNTQQPFLAFDGNDNSYWYAIDTPPTGGHWIKYDFGMGEKKRIIKMILKSLLVSGSSHSLKDVILYGSDDDIYYEEVFRGIQQNNANKQEYSFDNTKYYRYYKLVGTSYYLNNTGISTFEMFEAQENNLLELPSHSEKNLINYGIYSPIQVDGIFTDKNYILSPSQGNLGGIFEQDISRKPLTISSTNKLAILHNGVYYTSSDGTTLTPLNDSSEIETLGFNSLTLSQDIYSLVGESLKVVAFSNNEDDILIETTTEPFDIYDEFGDEVEVLYYTDDESVTEADLVLEANWSPIDELEGDFEVVTWTDEAPDAAQRTLELTTIPKPQFLKFQAPIALLSKVGQMNIINGQGGIRFLFSHDNTTWFKWDGSNFVTVDATTMESIAAIGNTSTEVNLIDHNDFMNKWNYDTFSLGVYLEDDIRDNFTSSVTDLILTESYPSSTSHLANSSFYILNTTAKIDLNLNGLTLSGTLSDDDLTRVQYRVKLNGQPYYPSDGNFTSLSSSPTSINLAIKSDEIKIGDWNDLEVEFQDYFGTTDSWQIQFLGKYAGLMFKTPQGDYYSSDIGQVLQYLDFGLVLTGQTTVEQTIVLKNEYGYRVKDIEIYANTSKFSEGLIVEFSKDAEQEWHNRLLLTSPLELDEEFVFNVRMRSDITTIPTGQGMFNIHVMAKKDE